MNTPSSATSSPTAEDLSAKVVEEIDQLNARLAEARSVVGKVIFGQNAVIDLGNTITVAGKVTRVDAAPIQGRKLLASVHRRFTEGFDTADFTTAQALLGSLQ